jgi:hypothetical protein
MNRLGSVLLLLVLLGTFALPASAQDSLRSLGDRLINVARDYLMNGTTSYPTSSPPAYPPSYPTSYPPTAPSPSYSGYENGSTTTTVQIRDLSRQELNVLANHDVTVMVDKSGSMKEEDCSFASRWQWSQNQIAYLGRQAAPVLSRGFRVVLFSSGSSVFDNVSAGQVPSIFNSTTPGGGTNLAKALKQELNDYFKRRDSAPYGSTKPLAIALITDGVPDSPRALRNVIIDATKRMQAPGEIAITFLQVGQDASGTRLLQELDYDLQSEGAVFDIVTMKPFAELQRQGLPRAIAEAASGRSRTSYR